MAEINSDRKPTRLELASRRMLRCRQMPAKRNAITVLVNEQCTVHTDQTFRKEIRDKVKLITRLLLSPKVYPSLNPMNVTGIQKTPESVMIHTFAYQITAPHEVVILGKNTPDSFEMKHDYFSCSLQNAFNKIKYKINEFSHSIS